MSETAPVHLCASVDASEAARYLQIGSGRGHKILVLGEAPAPHGWRVSGRAFYTPTGRLLPTGVRLNEWLQELDVTIEECSFTELVKCYVGNNRSLLVTCGKKTWPLLVEQVKRCSPVLILCLGKATHEAFVKCYGSTTPFGELSQVILGGRTYAYLSLFHPSPISPKSRPGNQKIFERYGSALHALLD